MEVYLVQHGAARSEAEDPSRPLTDEGRSGVEHLAEFLIPHRLELERVEHSGKLRARQTAEILAARLRPTHGMKEVTGLAPNDDLEPTRARLQRERENIMVVGHLPHLSRLVCRLLGLDIDRAVVRFQMGGVVRLDREEAGAWIVRWVLPPEVLPTGAR
jgi:phosphohistidine phosphatase